VSKDRGATVELIQRVRASRYSTIVLTVDTPVGGVRLRDIRYGVTIPPSLTPKSLAMIAVRPRWWFEALTREPLSFASMTSTEGTVADLLDRVFDPSLTPDDIEWVKGQWNGPVVVKGIQSVADAELAVRSGADAVIVSNHGGRQLDRSVTTLQALPGVVDAIGQDAEVYMDGGIRNGADAVAALALGAQACFVGRAYLYGLMAGGRIGVDKAIAILAVEMERTLRLLGARSVRELTPAMVTAGGRYGGPH
jgi:L-lactate dehydrogenase (cytochrome)